MTTAAAAPPALTIGPSVAAFCETYLTHPKGAHFDEPFRLEPWQRDFVNELYRVDQDGHRVYRQALLGVPRGNGKTPLAAALGLYELMSRRDAPDVFNVAGAKDQARLLTDFATQFVDRGKLKHWLKTQRGSITHKQTQGVMRLLASSGRLQHGLSVSSFIVDEVHALVTEPQEEVWTALWTAMHKREDAMSLGITTAGFDKETLLGRMYDAAMAFEDQEERNIVDGIGPCLRIGRDLENKVLVWWYGPPDRTELDVIDSDERIWRACNPASWVTLEGLRLQRGGLGMDEWKFARLHVNAWTQAKDVFIQARTWRNNRRPDVGLEPKRATFVAVDVGITHDTTAVAWSQPLPLEEPLENERSKEGGNEEEPPKEPPAAPVVTRVRIWSARAEHERDTTARHECVPDGRVDLEEIYEFCLELADRFRVRELVYDPTFFEGEAQRLAKHRIKVAPVHQAGVLPAIAYQRFYQAVKQTKAFHDGDPVYTRHVLAAAAVRTERGWKVSELRSSEPIDALQAGSMSYWRAARAQASVYATRGLLTVGGSHDERSRG